MAAAVVDDEKQVPAPEAKSEAAVGIEPQAEVTAASKGGDLAEKEEEEASAAVVTNGGDAAFADPPILQECGYYDVEQVQRVTGLLLFTLAAACVEKTIGAPFNQPASVLVDIKKEMIEYLEQQSLQYAVAFGSLSDRIQAPKPMKILHGFLDGFVRSKSNLLGRVSSRILNSDKKEEKIEEFVSEVDRAGVWMVGRREVFAKTLLRRIDRNMLSHCEMRFGSREELAEHKARCILRPTTCNNEGCTDVYSAIQADAHDVKCPSKRILCEQGCGDVVLRADMDKHCVTVCPMKMVPCPFQQVGCEDKLPQGTVEVHCAGNVSNHLLSVLQMLQRIEIGMEAQSQRVALLEKALAQAEGSEAVDDLQNGKFSAMQQELGKIKQGLKTDMPAEEIANLRRTLGQAENANGIQT